MVRALAAASLAILTALPAMAVTVNVRNCSNVVMAIELRNSATPSGTVQASTTGLAHGGTWSGSCSSGASCWIRVSPQLYSAENVQGSGNVCLIPRMSDGRYVIFGFVACPC